MRNRQILETSLCVLAVAGVFAFFAWLIAGPVAALVAACAVVALTGLGQMMSEQSDGLRSSRMGSRNVNWR